ncbi:MAG: sialidase family protein [Armatimonadota bacterium]
MASTIVLDLPHRPGNPRNSEGSFVTLVDGRILFVYSHYDGEHWADEASARLCARYSTDGGHTWSVDDVVVVENEGRCNVMSVSLLRLQDGRIGLWYMRKNSIADCRTYLRTSRDEGNTWSRPTPCIPAPGYFVVNNDRVVQLRSGRLIVPAAYHRNRLPAARCRANVYAGFDGRGIALFFLSDDGGRSWRESRDWWALPVRSESGLQEPGVVELTDGRLYAFCRTDTGRHYEMHSADGGDTWSPPHPSAFQAPCSPLCIKRIPATGDLLAIWNDHSGRLVDISTQDNTFTSTSWGRTPLVAAISRDDGTSWEQHTLIESDPARGFCYTAIHCLDDAVLLAYCCGGGGKSVVLQDLCIRRISLDWLYRASVG